MNIKERKWGPQFERLVGIFKKHIIGTSCQLRKVDPCPFTVSTHQFVEGK